MATSAPRASSRFVAVLTALCLAAPGCAVDDGVVTPDESDGAPLDDARVVDDVARDVSTRDAAADSAADASPDTSPPDDVIATDAATDRAATDVAITCPMPPPAYVVEGGRCVPSCLAAGGNLCDATRCAGRELFLAYDCTTCCATPPENCGGVPVQWTCTPDGRGRQRCASGAILTEMCAGGSCIPGTTTTNAVCGTAPSTCTGSASGSSPVWTCTSDRRARQRCVSGATQTETCTYGCSPMPTGVDDVCNPMPAPGGSGSVSCSLPQWWNLPYSWSPGYYSVRYGVDSDLRMSAGTGVQLRHASRLVAEGVYGWGWMPEFQDTVTGFRFRFLHLQPSRRLITAVGTVYPAGTLVGYSGGNTADTGYPTYSTGAHLCVQTQVPYRSAFPMGTDACR